MLHDCVACPRRIYDFIICMLVLVVLVVATGIARLALLALLIVYVFLRDDSLPLFDIQVLVILLVVHVQVGAMLDVVALQLVVDVFKFALVVATCVVASEVLAGRSRALQLVLITILLLGAIASTSVDEHAIKQRNIVH